MIYHIYNRGVNGETIFRKKGNYEYFLKLYAKHILPAADTYAFCLLGNHFHLLVGIKDLMGGSNGEGLAGSKSGKDLMSRNSEENLTGDKDGKNLNASTSEEDLTDLERNLSVRKASQAFSNLFNAYAKAINKAYGRTGPLFERPFKRIPVMDRRYFARLLVYIHQNPQRHGLIEDYRDWPYSSFQVLTGEQATFVRRDVVREWFGDVRELLEANGRMVEVEEGEDREDLTG